MFIGVFENIVMKFILHLYLILIILLNKFNNTINCCQIIYNLNHYYFPFHRTEFYVFRTETFRIGVSWDIDVHLGSRF